MNATESLTAKVGPLPAWAWGLGLGGAIVGVRWYRNRGKVTPVESVTSDGETASTGANTAGEASGDYEPDATVPGTVGGYTIPSAYQNYGGVITSSGTESGTSAADTGPQNNAAWRAAAFKVLRERNYGSVTATTALAKYLQGDPLTAAEEGMIDYALGVVGEPPEGAPQITRAAATPSTAAAPSPTAATSAPAPTPAFATPAPPLPWIKPQWLTGVRFVKGDGPAVYQVTDAGLEWVPSESAFYALGGGGTITLANGGTFTYQGKPNGIPPVVVTDATIASLPKVGPQP